MKKMVLIVSLIVLGLVSSVVIVYAGTETGTLDISANVVAVCTVTTSPVNFGDVTGELPETYANGDVTVNCPEGQAYNIALDAGLYYDGNYRFVGSSSPEVPYMLFKEAARSNEWGDSDFSNTFPYGSSIADTGTGVAQAHTVYGVLSGFSSVPAGTALTDAVTVTVHY